MRVANTAYQLLLKINNEATWVIIQLCERKTPNMALHPSFRCSAKTKLYSGVDPLYLLPISQVGLHPSGFGLSTVAMRFGYYKGSSCVSWRSQVERRDGLACAGSKLASDQDAAKVELEPERSVSQKLILLLLLFLFLRRGHTKYPWLAWNSLGMSDWPWTHTETCLPLPPWD